MLSTGSRVIVIAVLAVFAVTGCGDDEAAKSAAVPEVIAVVDDALAKPYDEYFKDIQGDYAVAWQIAGKVQNVIDQSDRMSMPHIMGLVEKASYLVKEPNEESYVSLVSEWNRVRGKIRLKKE